MSTHLPPDGPAERPERERITLTAEQLEMIRATHPDGKPVLRSPAVRTLLGDPTVSKATISRIRTGKQDFYHRDFHTPEMWTDGAAAKALEHEFLHAAEGAAERVLALLDDLADDTRRSVVRILGPSRVQAEDLLTDLAYTRLVDLAGHPGARRSGWRREVAYHAAIHAVREALQRIEEREE